MLNFKEFLIERRRATPVVRAWLDTRSKPYAYWLSRRFNTPFPLSKPMMERLGRGRKGVRALHSTDLKGLSTLLSLQNSSKSISVATLLQNVFAGTEFVEGIETEGGIVVELLGDVAFSGDYDIFTSSDSQGRRWLDLNQFSRSSGNHGKGMERRMAISEWQKKWEGIILDGTRAFINQNMNKLTELFEQYYTLTDPKGSQLSPGEISRYGRSMAEDMIWDATKKIDFAKVFWTGSQDYGIHGLDRAEVVVEHGVSAKIDFIDPVKYGSLKKMVNKGLFKLTKRLFVESEKFFKDRIDIFATFGKGETNAYDESVMDNFKITNVLYNIDASEGPFIEDSEIREVLRGSNIDPIPMSSMDWSMYFGDWTQEDDSK